jgi:transposase
MAKRGRKKDPRVELRRAQIAELLVERPGIRMREIAERFGISVPTAYADVKAIREEWAQRRLTAYESRLLDDYIRTDEAIAAIWPHVEAGKGWAIDRLCGLIQARMKLLGLDTVKHEIDIGELLARYLARRANDDDTGVAA